MRAVLQFKNYHVLETVYKYNPFDEDEVFSIAPEFDYRISQNPDNPFDAAVELRISIGDESLEEQPLFLFARILGMFEIRNGADLKVEQVDDFLKINAIAILYPYLRSLVSDLTSKGSESPIILPTMNIVEMMKGQSSGNQQE